MNLFGKAKKSNINNNNNNTNNNTKESIIRLRETVETLEKRERHLQSKIETELQLARANMHKNKKLSLMALKRKKMYEGEVEKIMGARMTLETQSAMLEGANVNMETMNAMKSGAEAMKRIHSNMKIEQVDETMDSIRDQMDFMKEIGDAISQPLGYGVDLDEDELNAELDALEQEELDSQLLNVEPVPSNVMIGLPGVPSTEPSVAQPPRPNRQQVVDDEDAELAELRASMAI